jgi:hypothetical protein
MSERHFDNFAREVGALGCLNALIGKRRVDASRVFRPHRKPLIIPRRGRPLWPILYHRACASGWHEINSALEISRLQAPADGMTALLPRDVVVDIVASCAPGLGGWVIA